jgi:hypothetical protein
MKSFDEFLAAAADAGREPAPRIDVAARVITTLQHQPVAAVVASPWRESNRVLVSFAAAAVTMAAMVMVAAWPTLQTSSDLEGDPLAAMMDPVSVAMQ